MRNSMDYDRIKDVMEAFPVKTRMKMFAKKCDDMQLKQLFEEFDRLGKERHLRHLIKACRKRKRDIPQYIIEKHINT